MQKTILFLFLALSISGFAQQGTTKKDGGLLNKANGLFKKASGGGSALSNDEIIAGLKEALSVGANNSSQKLAAVDGFFADAAIKVLMPEEAKKVESTLRA